MFTFQHWNWKVILKCGFFQVQTAFELVACFLERQWKHQVPMQQSKSSTSTVLIVLLLVFTFPIWIGIAGGLFGLIAGIFGAVIGIIAAIFGAIFGVIGGVFGWSFDWPSFTGWFHAPIFVIAAVAIVVLLITRKK